LDDLELLYQLKVHMRLPISQ